MNDYKELIEELREHCLCITDGCNCGNCEGLLADKAYCLLQIELHKQAADAIAELVRERDAATHDLDMAVCGQESYPCQYCANYGIAPINVDDVCKTCTDCENWEWRGVQE